MPVELIEQITEFKLKLPGPQSCTCTLKLVIFMTKQNSPNQINIRVIIYC